MNDFPDVNSDSDDESDMDESIATTEEFNGDNANVASRSGIRSPTLPNNGEENDDDDVVQAIIASTKKLRVHPPDIVTEDFVVDLSFHPNEDILAVGTITGDVLVYKYSNEENTLLNTIEVHSKAIRDIEFNCDGTTLFSVSKDKSILMTDIETGKFKRFYDKAHESPIYKIHLLCENLFATGKVVT